MSASEIEWAGRAITLPDDPGRERQSPSPFLRREFEVVGHVARAQLRVTALGLHRVTINGQLVSDELLAPGWTAYRHRLLVDTYDVTGLLAQGTNVIGAALGDGWWRGRLGWDPTDDRGRYGKQVALIAQLEIEHADGSTSVIATDGEWRASTGEILFADLYDGCETDFRRRQPGWDRAGFDASGWVPVTSIPFDASILEPRTAPPVRVVATLPTTVIDRGDGTTMLDGGQNISGWVRLTVRGAAGDRVSVRHAEILEAEGALHTRALRSAKATDAYTLDQDGEVTLEPSFTFHGFRFAEVETTATVVASEYVAISSDTARRGTFECSDAALNRFHENVVWSQRDNFVSVPSDCPQRDERLGWTGDAQAFAATACTLFDSQSFWLSWLRDLALDQDPQLGVSTVVPDVVLQGDPRFGRAGWSDAATIVPWAVYESYGDSEVLRRQYDSMRGHVESLQRRAGADGLLPETMQFGDWLDPDAPSDRPWMAKADSTFIANAFFAHSARLTGDAAEFLGRAEDAAGLRSQGEAVARATWARWADHAVTNQTGCAVALQLGIAPDAERERVAAALAQMVRAADGRVSTGFLGTPLVLPALAAAGHWDEAYLMLLRHAAPSWLYQVDQGATTVWERWDAILPDGSIHDGRMAPPPGIEGGTEGHMLSFNHYAYGAVIDWVYRHVAGIAPDVAEPGYRHIVFAPRPAAGIEWARASVRTGYGEASIDWRRVADGSLHVELTVPNGTHATFLPPTDDSSATELQPGRHVITVPAPIIAGAMR